MLLSSAEHKGRYFEERLEPKSCLEPLGKNTMEDKSAPQLSDSNLSSKYLPLCSAEEKKNSYSFATT